MLMYNLEEERARDEERKFIELISFVDSRLDEMFKECGIVCGKMTKTNVCGIIHCWTFESVDPRTPAQRVRILEALEQMIRQLPDAGFAPHLSHISFPGAGVRLVHLEIYPRQFDSIKVRFEEIRRRAIECPERANNGGLINMSFLLKNTGRYEYNL